MRQRAQSEFIFQRRVSRGLGDGTRLLSDEKSLGVLFQERWLVLNEDLAQQSATVSNVVVQVVFGQIEHVLQQQTDGVENRLGLSGGCLGLSKTGVKNVQFRGQVQGLKLDNVVFFGECLGQFAQDVRSDIGETVNFA